MKISADDFAAGEPRCLPCASLRVRPTASYYHYLYLQMRNPAGNPLCRVADGTGVCRRRPVTERERGGHQLAKSNRIWIAPREAARRLGKRTSRPSGGFPELDENTRAISGVAINAVPLSLVLIGCGSKSNNTQESATATNTTNTSAAAAAPGSENTAGPNPTIATYVQENHIQETPIHRGDPGAPDITCLSPRAGLTLAETLRNGPTAQSSTPAQRRRGTPQGSSRRCSN